MATRTFRLLFEMTVTEPTEAALPDEGTIRSVVEDFCPSAMVEAIEDAIDHEDNEPGVKDAIVLISVEQVDPQATKAEA